MLAEERVEDDAAGHEDGGGEAAQPEGESDGLFDAGLEQFAGKEGDTDRDDRAG